MAGEIIIKKRFTPRVGEGRNLRAALMRMSDALEESGFAPMELWSPMHGAHNQMVTIERFASLDKWMEYNATATGYPALVSGVFDGIYPTNLDSYDTEILGVVERAKR